MSASFVIRNVANELDVLIRNGLILIHKLRMRIYIRGRPFTMYAFLGQILTPPFPPVRTSITLRK